MHTPSVTTLRLTQALLTLAASLTCAAALAASTASTAEAQARYSKERAVCLNGQSNQDRATCLREAGAALAESRHGGLSKGNVSYVDNQRRRCESLTGDDRLACQERMRGQGTTSGSVAEGGIYRELVTPETGRPAKPMPMPMPMQKPMPMPTPMPATPPTQ